MIGSTLRKRMLVRLTATATAGLLVLAGCGDSDLNEASSSPAAPSSSAAPSSMAETSAPASSSAEMTDSAESSAAETSSVAEDSSGSSAPESSSAAADPSGMTMVPVPEGDCGTVNLAMNAWVGYTASASVFAYVAEKDLGCTVNKVDLNEQVAWQGFGTGEIDAIIENWSHLDLKKKYVDEEKTAVIAGKNGNVGQIGWFVPPWMVAKYPDILDYNNLNKYADLFVTSESNGKGQLLDGDSAFVTNDAALIKNLGLNFEVVYSGSEAALIEGFRAAEKNKTPLLGYFYSPQWFLSEVDLQRVALPAYTDGCDADLQAVACDYPADNLDKIASTTWSTSGSPGYALFQNFNWTNDDQNSVALDIEGGMDAAAAAQKWVEANPDKVAAWLGK